MAELEVDFELQPLPTIEADFEIALVNDDHSVLRNRDKLDQHPMESITGLTDTISNISSSVYDNHEAILELSQTKVDKVITGNIVYGTDGNGDQTTYNVDSFGQVDDVQVGGVSVVTNKIAELGTMAGETATDYYTKTEANNEFATTAQGAKADTAIQPLDNITELTNNAGYITASSVKDGTLTIQKNGALVATFTANQEGNSTANLVIPTNAADVGALPDTTTVNDLTTPAQQAALNSGATSTNIAQIATNTGDISTINGKIPSAASSSNQLADKSYVDSADNNLQQQIDAITAASDVTDIVGTYADLQNYDTTDLPNNSIIKVLQDESRYDETTYYRWVITAGVGAWVLIGEEGPYYTKFETDTLLQAKQNEITSSNMLSADLVDDTNSTNKFVTASDIITWNAKQNALTAGTGIDITSDTISNTGVRAVSTGATNGTISVNTNGTSAEVPVYGLGSAAYTASTAYDASGAASTAETNAKNYADSLASNYATAAQGALADTAVQPSDLNGYATETWVGNQGYITGITSGDVTTALGYTPADSASLATVATSGNYSDLSNKPTIPTTTDSVTSGSTAVLTSGGAYTALQSYATTSAIANMQTTTNLVTSVSSSSTDSQYPSAKLLYDTCGDIETLINAL